ncbi:MAG: TylF/MycF/NovP-related O-methyltransferase [Candidatus Giovannonibacteria bacterium]|nr:TylF/MycF/NovP-related O-methyltransferase [Candidatus Giovannonibacteria bacterium]
MYPRLVKGGVFITDDYGVFPGETKAVNDFFKNKKVKIQCFPKLKTPHFIIKRF